MTDPERREDVRRQPQIETRKRNAPGQAGDLADMQSLTPATWGPGMWWRIGLGALVALVLVVLIMRVV